jgi:hypothetical protein
MKTIALFLSICFFVLAAPAQACMVGKQKMDSLHQVFNTLFYEPGDTNRMEGNIPLFQSGYLLPDGEDLQFGDPGDTLRIDLTFNHAFFGNELGYMAGNGYYTLVEDQYSQNGRFNFRKQFKNKSSKRYNGQNLMKHFNLQDVEFTIPEAFMFADTVSVAGSPMQRWYADADLNPFGQKDHFLAFAIDDQSLLNVYNQLFGFNYLAELDNVWMIAFEDLNLGDADYTDLVAIVSRPYALNYSQEPVHAPLPGAFVLLFSGLTAIAGLRARRSKRLE